VNVYRTHSTIPTPTPKEKNTEYRKELQRKLLLVKERLGSNKHSDRKSCLQISIFINPSSTKQNLILTFIKIQEYLAIEPKSSRKSLPLE